MPFDASDFRGLAASLATVTVVAGFAACGAGRIATPGGSSAAALPGGNPRGSGSAAGDGPTSGYVTSNVLRGDYAGSESCQPCHADIYRAWRDSPMRRMTRTAETAEVKSPFDGKTFVFKDDSVTLTSDQKSRFVAISSRTFGDHVYRVTRVIGGRYREDFAGVEVAEPRAASQPLRDPKRELILPVTYVYSPPSFRLKGYSVMVDERPGLKAGGVWNQTCIFCHNTAPYLSSLFGELIGADAPGYQGEVVDRLLPPDRRSSFGVAAPDALVRALDGETRFLGSSEAPTDVPRALDAALRATRAGFEASHLVEIGIGCESCHGGSREHVDSPAKRPSFDLRSAAIRAEPSPWDTSHHADHRATAINRTCARCHQVLFSRYPYTWEGRARNADPGGSHISSGEARDFLLGGCTSQLSCVACHDPHAADAPEKLRALATPAGNRVCVGCHRGLGESEALRAHAHHDPTGAGAACIACHMPQKNMGLGYNLTRYHRIGSPTERARVEGDRPLECALCHADKTVRDLVTSMERFWDKRFDRARLVFLYGSLDALPLVATVQRGKAHEQATAIHVLGANRVGAAATPIAAELVNRYPLVRYYARQALEAIAGVPCDVNLDADDDRIRADASRWLSSIPSVPSR